MKTLQTDGHCEFGGSTGQDRYGLTRNSPCFIPKKYATTENAIIEGRTIINTVEGAITAVSATVATATITASGTTERVKSNSIVVVVSRQA
jgi:hypothetical protein